MNWQEDGAMSDNNTNTVQEADDNRASYGVDEANSRTRLTCFSAPLAHSFVLARVSDSK